MNLNPSLRRGGIVAVGIALLLGIAYAPSLSYPYVQDAVPAADRNAVVERGDWGEIFASHYWKGTISSASSLYRPTTVLSFALERGADRAASPRRSHLVNIAIHGVSAWLLFAWVARWRRPAVGAAAGALFAAHPIGIHVAASVAGRADGLALAFGLGALLLAFHARRADEETTGSGMRSAVSAHIALWGAGLALFLALGAKEIAWAFPIVLCFQEGLFARATRRFALAFCNRFAVWTLACVVALHLRVRAIGVFPGLQVVPPEDNVLVGLEGASRVWTSLAMVGRYLALALWPAALSGDYSGTAVAPESSPLGAYPLAGIFVLAVAAVALIVGGREIVRRLRSAEPAACSHRAVLGLFACLGSAAYLLVGNLLVLNAAGFAERLIYIPLAAGIALTIAWFGSLRPVREASVTVLRAATAAIAVVLLALTFQARSEARMWESDRALFEHAVRSSPRSLRANMALAQGHRREGRPEVAAGFFQAMVDAAPDDPGSWSDYGIFLAQRGDYPAARDALKRAIELDPAQGAAWVWLGAVQRRLQEPAQAERALRIGTYLRPDIALGLEELGDHYFRRGDFRRALELWNLPAAQGSAKLRPLRAEAERRLRIQRSARP